MDIEEFIGKDYNYKLLEEDNFEELYLEAVLQDWRLVHPLTAFFKDNGVNPLEYMSKMPSYYMEGFANVPQDWYAVPNGIKSIGSKSFRKSDIEEANLPDSVETIFDGAYIDCYNLKKVVTNASTIMRYAFAGCRNLEYVELKNPDVVVHEGAFFDVTNFTIKCSEMVENRLKSEVKNNNVTFIR